MSIYNKIKGIIRCTEVPELPNLNLGVSILRGTVLNMHNAVYKLSLTE